MKDNETRKIEKKRRKVGRIKVIINIDGVFVFTKFTNSTKLANFKEQRDFLFNFNILTQKVFCKFKKMKLKFFF
jgi:hypothetical protein